MKKESKLLKSDKITIVILLFVTTLFVVLGFTVMEENTFTKWVTIIFFGLCIVVFIIELLPNSSYLKLTNEGFEIRNFYRSHFTKWTDVSGFGIYYVSFNTMVAFDYTEEHTKHKTRKKIARFLSSYQGALPQTYGMKAIKLAALMNEWKYRSEGVIRPVPYNHSENKKIIPPIPPT